MMRVFLIGLLVWLALAALLVAIKCGRVLCRRVYGRYAINRMLRETEDGAYHAYRRSR